MQPTYKSCVRPTKDVHRPTRIVQIRPTVVCNHEQLQKSEQLTSYSRSDTRTFFNEVCVRHTVQIGPTVQPEAAEKPRAGRRS